MFQTTDPALSLFIWFIQLEKALSPTSIKLKICVAFWIFCSPNQNNLKTLSKKALHFLCVYKVSTQPGLRALRILRSNGTTGKTVNCRTPDLPNSPVQLLIGKSGRLYIRMVVRLFVCLSSHF